MAGSLWGLVGASTVGPTQRMFVVYIYSLVGVKGKTKL